VKVLRLVHWDVDFKAVGADLSLDQDFKNVAQNLFLKRGSSHPFLKEQPFPPLVKILCLTT